MNVLELEKRICLIQKELKKIYTLNNGGCIHFAYYLSDALETLNIPHKVYFCDRYEIGRTYSSFSSCNHVLVYIPNIGYVDGHKTYKNINYSHKVNIKLNLNRLRTEYTWNYAYDSERYNKKILETIKEYLSDY